MKPLRLIFYFFTPLFLLSSCARYASEKDFDQICLHMNKEDVVKTMSSKGVARGSIINKYGQVIEVREYILDKGKNSDEIAALTCLSIYTLGLATPLFFTHGDLDTYWLYFCNGKLVQWGKAGDWAEAQKSVYDINFNVTLNK
jgi:hypothetical protein